MTLQCSTGLDEAGIKITKQNTITLLRFMTSCYRSGKIKQLRIL